jgi:hypothetical protein
MTWVKTLLGSLAAVAVASGIAMAAGDDAETPTHGLATTKVCRPVGPGTLLFRGVFIAGRDGDRLQRSRYGSDGSFSKVGLLVHDGTTVELSTDPDGSVRLIEWDTDEPQYTAVVDDSTPHDGVQISTTSGCSSQWRFYAGGFISKRKQCATLHALVGERTKDIRFGLGTRCRTASS